MRIFSRHNSILCDDGAALKNRARFRKIESRRSPRAIRAARVFALTFRSEGEREARSISNRGDRENRCGNRTEPKRFENVEDNRAFSRSRAEIIARELH